VEWLIYGDLDPGGAIPPNVTFKPTTISELNRRCSDLLGTRIDIQRRKLCDLKITYGVIFADDLGSFDFWSCSDLDIVWGQHQAFRHRCAAAGVRHLLIAQGQALRALHPVSQYARDQSPLRADSQRPRLVRDRRIMNTWTSAS
jgi:hypothetical protein